MAANEIATPKDKDKGVRDKIGSCLLLIVFLFHLIYSVNGFDRLGMYLEAIQVRAIAFFLVSLTVFWFLPGPRGDTASKNRFRWYDYILLLVSLLFTAYIVVGWETYAVHLGHAMGLEVVLGLAAILVTLELARRTVGWAMIFLAIACLIYYVFGNYVPGFFHTNGAGADMVSGQMWLNPFGIYGSLLAVVVDYVFPFMVFTFTLEVTGGALFFSDLASSLIHDVRGTAAKMTIILNYLVGFISGSAVANVYITGPIALPKLKKEGHSPAYAGALVAVAGTASQITPPVMGIVAFVMADMLRLSYIKVCLFATIPAFLYYLSLYLFSDLDQARLGLKSSSPAIGTESNDRRPDTKQVIKKGWHVVVALIVLVSFLAARTSSVRISVILSTAVLIALGLFRKETRINVNRLKLIVEGTSRSLIDMVPICAIAGIIVAVLGATSLDYKFSIGIISAAGGHLILILFMAALACGILGMGLPTLPAYLIVVMMIVPPLAKMGIAPICTHMFVFYFAMGAMITPPVCLSVYVVAPMVHESIWKVGLSAVRLGMATYIVPFMFIYRPGLLLQGGFLNILYAVIIAIVAIVGMCFGFSKYGLAPASRKESILALVGAALLFWNDARICAIGWILVATIGVVQVLKFKRLSVQKVVTT